MNVWPHIQALLVASSFDIFLQEVQSNFLDIMSQHIRRHMCSSPHCGRCVCGHLNQVFGHDGPVPWEPRSSDLISMGLFIWGALKSSFYAMAMDSDMDIWLQVLCVLLQISNKIQVNFSKSSNPDSSM